MTDKKNEVKRTATLTESEIQEVSGFIASLEVHMGNMWDDIIDQDEEAMKKTLQKMRHDLDNVALWLYGGQCANITERNNG